MESAWSEVPLKMVYLPFQQRTISMLLPDEPYALVDDLRDPRVNIYWAALWPSALALADAILSGEITLRGQALLETGCGTGLASIAVALSDPAVNVLATDIEPRALELTQSNAQRNEVANRIRTQQLDWRERPPRQYPTILAADCLYEEGSDGVLAQFLHATLNRSPGARAIVVDPERHTARNFHYVAREAGFQVRSWLRNVPFVQALGPLGGKEAAQLFAAKRRVEQPPQVRFYECRFG